jgi:co-chaperonin GroES (HSP10)|tara:strand:+ start:407 stop:694 length:288 start_codon:yes stop_codon:yes gene_type:complete
MKEVVFRPLGQYVVLQQNSIGKEKTTESGIIYNDNARRNGMIWSKVMAVGDRVEEDIQPGDMVLWNLASLGGRQYGNADIVHEKDIEVVDRNEAG